MNRESYKPHVTLGWDMHPTVLTESGHVYPRALEKIVHAQYYPTGTKGEWPCDPVTGEKLPMEPPPDKAPEKAPIMFWILLAVIGIIFILFLIYIFR